MSETAASPSNRYKIGLAGCGKMGSAMVRAWLDSDLLAQIDILDPHAMPEDLPDASHIRFFSKPDAFAARSADWDMLILAVKPQTMAELCKSLQELLPDSLPVLSIAAGQTTGSLSQKLGHAHPVIRCMPNTPAAIRKGMSVLYAPPSVSLSQNNMADHLMKALGHVKWVDDETMFDAVTAVSGSGPAYVFLLIEAMAQAGVEAGLDSTTAMTLARQTTIGAAALAEHESGRDVSVLRKNVTSSGGTTAAALSVLMDGSFQNALTAAIKAAAKRSKELSA